MNHAWSDIIYYYYSHFVDDETEAQTDNTK